MDSPQDGSTAPKLKNETGNERFGYKISGNHSATETQHCKQIIGVTEELKFQKEQ